MSQPVNFRHYEQTAVDGLFKIHLRQISEPRGFFTDVVNYKELEEVIGKPINTARMLHSNSVDGVLRGLHAEPWQKIFYISRGQVFSAIADIRPESRTFGKVAINIIDNKTALYIPPGCANGFQVISGPVDLIYLVEGYYNPNEKKPAIAWNDPDLAIPWPNKDPILSELDKRNPTMRETFPEKYK